MRFLSALIFSALLPTAIEAATYRVNVEGAYLGGVIDELRYFDTLTGELNYLQNVNLMDSVVPEEIRALFPIAETFGTMRVEESDNYWGLEFATCSGILGGFCAGSSAGTGFDSSGAEHYSWTSDYDADLLVNLDFGPLTSDSVGSLKYSLFDLRGSTFSWEDGTRQYAIDSFLGLDFGYNITSYSVTVVPLPPAGWALLASIGLLGLIGRRKRATQHS